MFKSRVKESKSREVLSLSKERVKAERIIW